MLASLLALIRIERAKFYSRCPTSRCRLSHDGKESDVQVGNVQVRSDTSRTFRANNQLC